MNQGKGVVDLGSGIKQKIVKEKLGQYTKTEHFTFAKKKYKEVQMKRGSGGTSELSRLIKKMKWLRRESIQWRGSRNK